MKKKLKIIFNPISGSGLDSEKLKHIKQYFRDHNYILRWSTTKKKGDATLFAKEIDDSFFAVIVIGGDGTINEVVNGLQGRQIPIGIIPQGTGNLLAKELEISQSIEKACSVIKKSKTISMDLGYDTKRYFFLMAGIGMDAEIVYAINAARKGNISMSTYIMPIIKTIINYRLPRVTVMVDGNIVEKDASFVFVSNVKGYFGPVRFAYLAKTNDGQFDICILKGRKKLHILKYIIGAATGTLRLFSDVVYLRGRSIIVDGNPSIQYQLDGDPGGNLPARFEIIPAPVRFFVP